MHMEECDDNLILIQQKVVQYLVGWLAIQGCQRLRGAVSQGREGVSTKPCAATATHKK